MHCLPKTMDIQPVTLYTDVVLCHTARKTLVLANYLHEHSTALQMLVDVLQNLPELGRVDQLGLQKVSIHEQQFDW